MPKLFKILLLALCTVSSAATAHAQKFLWEIGLDCRFDNREYGSEIAADGTIFGTRLSPQAGLGWGESNALMIGFDLRADFGQREFPSPEGVFYYRYADSRFKAFAGIFPRKNIIGGYPYAFFSDSVRFYDNNLEGVLLQYHGRRGYLEFGCDWNSRISGEQREKFMVFMAGRLDFCAFHVGFNANMYHHAGSEIERGVVDNILIYPYAGADIGQLVNFSELSLRVGWLQAFQNDRRYVGEYVRKGGIQIDTRIEKWGVGVGNSLYLGGGLMPYYIGIADGQPAYGDGLYYGEPFYRTSSGIYNRLELYWNPVSKGGVKLHVGSVFHYDGSVVGWQQVLSLQVAISDKMFGKKR